MMSGVIQLCLLSKVASFNLSLLGAAEIKITNHSRVLLIQSKDKHDGTLLQTSIIFCKIVSNGASGIYFKDATGNLPNFKHVVMSLL